MKENNSKRTLAELLLCVVALVVSCVVTFGVLAAGSAAQTAMALVTVLFICACAYLSGRLIHRYAG